MALAFALCHSRDLDLSVGDIEHTLPQLDDGRKCFLPKRKMPRPLLSSPLLKHLALRRLLRRRSSNVRRLCFRPRQLLTVSAGHSLELAKGKVVKVRTSCHFDFFPYSIADPAITGGRLCGTVTRTLSRKSYRLGNADSKKKHHCMTHQLVFPTTIYTYIYL